MEHRPDGAWVNWQDLVCASCSGRVADGRCATCRATRREFSQRSTLPAQAILLAAAVLALLLLVLAHLS